MGLQDAELEQFRQGISCAVVLERFGAPWQLDRKQSTRHALKYRRGAGEVLIINHDGRGWWDPMSTARGDVFSLVQHLDQSLNFGQVRKVLRPFVGMSASFPEAQREDRRQAPARPIPERWNSRPRLQEASPAWRYLTRERGLPQEILAAADRADVVREGIKGGAWFAHRCDEGLVSHIEVRGPDWKGSLKGGNKTLFRFAGGHGTKPHRLAITEAPIDALSLAAVEQMRAGTLYVATGGGMGPRTIEALYKLLADLVVHPDALVASATDVNAPGERYAEAHAQLAATAGVPFERLKTPVGVDWNDAIRPGRAA